jgi:hypothetical protein
MLMEKAGESRGGRLGEGVILTRRGTVRRLCPHPLLHYCQYVLLGNSGKLVTLETSWFMKFVKCVFRNKEFAVIESLESAKPRNHEPVKTQSHERVKP